MCGLTGLVWFYGPRDSWEKAESVLTAAWIFPDGRAEARAYLATAVQASVERLPPSQLMRQLTGTGRHLATVLAVLGSHDVQP